MKDGKKTARGKPALWTAIAIAGAVLFALTRQPGFLGVAAVAVYIVRKEAKAHSQQAQPKITINDEKTFQEWMSEHPAAASKDGSDSNSDSGKYTHEQAARILQKLCEMTSHPAVRIKAEDRTEKPPLPPCASKFGGLPYWEAGEDYPKDENGNPLYLLAQINFADVPHFPDYPTSGLLQIFIANDDVFGCDFNNADGKNIPQKNWRLVWRDEADAARAMSAQELSAIGVRAAQKTDIDKDGNEFPLELPIQNEFGVSFSLIQSSVNPNCDDFEDAVKKAAAALGFPVYDKDSYEVFSEDDFNEFCGDGRIAPHQIGGYPDFTQGDARREGDILLFQMASEWIATGGDDDDDTKNAIMWGDMGIANFFITRVDLKARTFTNVLYNWDCY